MLQSSGYPYVLPKLTDNNDIQKAISVLNNKFPLNKDFNFEFKAPYNVTQYIKTQISDLPDEYQKYIECKSGDLAMVASIKTSVAWDEAATSDTKKPKMDFTDKQGNIYVIKNNEGVVETAIVTPQEGNFNKSSVVFSHKPLGNKELVELLNNTHAEGLVKNVPIYNLKAESAQPLVGRKPSKVMVGSSHHATLTQNNKSLFDGQFLQGNSYLIIENTRTMNPVKSEAENKSTYKSESFYEKDVFDAEAKNVLYIYNVSKPIKNGEWIIIGTEIDLKTLKKNEIKPETATTKKGAKIEYPCIKAESQYKTLTNQPVKELNYLQNANKIYEQTIVDTLEKSFVSFARNGDDLNFSTSPLGWGGYKLEYNIQTDPNNDIFATLQPVSTSVFGFGVMSRDAIEQFNVENNEKNIKIEPKGGGALNIMKLKPRGGGALDIMKH